MRLFKRKGKNIEYKVNAAEQLNAIVTDFFGYKAKNIENIEEKEVRCILYDAFQFRCDVQDEHGRFGAAIIAEGEGYTICDMLGKSPSLNSDVCEIEKSLQIVDRYCRMRLPNKYLNAYEEAYEVKQVEPT